MLIVYNLYMKVRVWEMYILLLLMNILLLWCTCKAYGKKEQHGNHIIVICLGFFLRWTITSLWTFFKIKSCVALFVIISQLHLKCWPCTPNVHGLIAYHKSNEITTMKKHVEYDHFAVLKMFLKDHVIIEAPRSPLDYEPNKKKATISPSNILVFFLL